MGTRRISPLRIEYLHNASDPGRPPGTREARRLRAVSQAVKGGHASFDQISEKDYTAALSTLSAKGFAMSIFNSIFGSKSLPAKFDKALRQKLGARAVWLPGSPLTVGSIMMVDKKVLKLVDHVSSFGVQIQSSQSSEGTLSLRSSKTKATIIQGSANYGDDTTQLDLSAKARLEISFSSATEFFLASGAVQCTAITNMLAVGKAIAKSAGWTGEDYDNFYIVHEAYVAPSYTLLGSEKKASSIKFDGTGAAVVNFLKVGANIGLTSSGSTELNVSGAGALAINLFRVTKTGGVKLED
jgi:hypothetical protein